MKVNRSLAWDRLGRTLLTVQATGTPADADWREAMQDAAQPPPEAVVVVVGDGKLTAQQRTDVQRFHERHGSRSVVVSDSVAARVILTALTWFGVKVRGFPSSALDLALESAGVPPGQHGDARASIARLKAALAEQR